MTLEPIFMFLCQHDHSNAWLFVKVSYKQVPNTKRFIIESYLLQMDKKTNKPKIWMYNDKATGRPKGEATVTYDDANAAKSAISWFDGNYFLTILFVFLQ